MADDDTAEDNRCRVCEAAWDEQVEFLAEKLAQDADWRQTVASSFLEQISKPHLALNEMGFAKWWDERQAKKKEERDGKLDGSTGM